MIEIQNLSRQFGAIKAVDEISFQIEPGEIIGFLGPNGAGKTTTMRMMVGYLQPSAGAILIDGKSIFDDPIATSRKIGYLPENNPLYDDMTVYEFLDYIAALREIRGDAFSARLNYVMQNCGLTEVLHQKIGTLSKGYRQRTGLAQAIIHDPEILIMDEPTSGLDPNQILEIRDLILELGKSKTLILSSHIMQEVQALCDRIIIIDKGRIVANDSKENLVRGIGKTQTLQLELEAVNPDFSELLEQHTVSLKSFKQIDERCELVFEAPAELDLKRILARFCAAQGWLVLGSSTKKHSLEDIFVNLTKGGQDYPEERQITESSPETDPEEEALPEADPDLTEAAPQEEEQA